MSSSTSTMTFTPHQSSPLARTISPFKDPRPPPCTPGKTAKLWDEYERRAVENAKIRDGITLAPSPKRSSASNIGRGYEPQSVLANTVTRSSFDFRFRRATPSTTVAICKTCKQPITYTSGGCERCKKIIILPTPTGETTPPLSPSARNFASTNLQQLHKNSSIEKINMPVSNSPKRKSFCPLPLQLVDPPIRLSSLRPPPMQDIILEPNRSRKTSLTDPNEPFLRLQIAHQTHARSSHPTTPTYIPTTPPSTSHSRSSTRPPSLANIASLPTYSYARNNSATPSEFSTLYPYASTTTTSPPSLSRVNYALHSATSAWDDWDSDSEGEKVGLVGWIGKRKGRPKGKERSGSKDSKDSLESNEVVSLREKAKKKSQEDERLEQVRVETAESARLSRSEAVRMSAKNQKKKRPSGFVRAISCGCREE